MLFRSGEGELSAGTQGYKEQAAGIKEAGAFRVLQFGDHHCVAVEQPHPGFFAYVPLIQPLLFPLLVCCSALVSTHGISWCDEANGSTRYYWADLIGSPSQSIRWPNRNLGQAQANLVVEELQKHVRLRAHNEATRG